jgi:hypothetical protein
VPALLSSYKTLLACPLLCSRKLLRLDYIQLILILLKPVLQLVLHKGAAYTATIRSCPPLMLQTR